MKRATKRSANGFEVNSRSQRDAAYSRVIDKVNKSTPEQIFKRLVDVGIYTKNGRPTRHYQAIQAAH